MEIHTEVPKPDKRRIRIWLDSCWLINTQKDHALIPELKEFLASLHERGLQPELALTRTVFNEVTNVPDPKLLEQGLLDIPMIQHWHESNALRKLVPESKRICGLLRDLNDYVVSLDPNSAPDGKAVILVDTRHCKKEDSYISNALVMRMDTSFSAASVLELVDYKKRIPNFNVPRDKIKLVEGVMVHNKMKEELSAQPQSNIIDFLAFEDCHLDNPVAKPDNFFSDPIFHMVAHDWLLGDYPCPANRGDFSMMSGVKTCDSNIQIILSHDGIEKLGWYDKWHRNNGHIAEVVNPMYLPAMTKAVQHGNLEDLKVFQNAKINKLCDVINGSFETAPEQSWAQSSIRPKNGQNSPSDL